MNGLLIQVLTPTNIATEGALHEYMMHYNAEKSTEIYKISFINLNCIVCEQFRTLC